MSKRKSKSSKRNTPIRQQVSAFKFGDDGDDAIEVSTRRYIEVVIDGIDQPVELNRREAATLGRALIEAARRS